MPKNHLVSCSRFGAIPTCDGQTECFLSGRGQGHVSNFYIVDLENIATASRRYTGDIHNGGVAYWLAAFVDFHRSVCHRRFVYDTLPPTKPSTAYHRFGQDLSHK